MLSLLLYRCVTQCTTNKWGRNYIILGFPDPSLYDLMKFDGEREVVTKLVCIRCYHLYCDWCKMVYKMKRPIELGCLWMSFNFFAHISIPIHRNKAQKFWRYWFFHLKLLGMSFLICKYSMQWKCVTITI